MAHSKCVRCRARVWRRQPSDLCPGCGGDLQDVVALSELVGLRSLGARRSPTRVHSTEHFERVSQQIREAMARHDAKRRTEGEQP